MKRLKTISLFRILKDNYAIILLVIILELIVLFSKNYILLIIIALYLIYLYKHSKKIVVFIIVVILIVFINYLIRLCIYTSTTNEIENAIMKVVDISKKDTNYQVVLKCKCKKYITYMEDANIGDVYLINAIFKEADVAHYNGGFNYQQYLYSRGISGILEINSCKYIKNEFTIKNLHILLSNHLDKVLKTEALGMIKALTIGNKNSFDDKLFSKVSQIGISHLFVISGLHVGLIVNFLTSILDKLKMKDKFSIAIIILVLAIYYLICGLAISVFRVIYNYILSLFNKTYHLNLSKVDIICINVLTVVVVNPFVCISYSFLLSYAIAGGIILFSFGLKEKGRFTFIFNNIYISIISILVTIPLLQRINPDINVLSIVYNLFYIPFVSYIMLPFSYLVVIIPKLEIIFFYIYSGFGIVTTMLSNIKIFTITYPNISIYMIILYYILLYVIFSLKEQNKKINKVLICFIFLNIIWINSGSLSLNDEVTFLDLPKGEATLIRKSFNQANILIDTGENGYDDILLFLKKEGIRRLDFIILSHSDSDHTGMLDEIIDEFKVRNVIVSTYDKITPCIIDKNINIIKAKKGTNINYKNIMLDFISPGKDYNDSNNNSLVFKMNVFNRSYLFTGDIEKQVEEDLNEIGYVDFLKVAHHGSNTSTTNTFLAKVDFSYAICMNGYKNSFSFPSKTVLDRIKEPTLVTSYCHSIIIKKNFFSNRTRICYKN